MKLNNLGTWSMNQFWHLKFSKCSYKQEFSDLGFTSINNRNVAMIFLLPFSTAYLCVFGTDGQ